MIQQLSVYSGTPLARYHTSFFVFAESHFLYIWHYIYLSAHCKKTCTQYHHDNYMRMVNCQLSMYNPPPFLHYTHRQVYSTHHSKQGVKEAKSTIYHICKTASSTVLLQQISQKNYCIYHNKRSEFFPNSSSEKLILCEKSHLIFKQIRCTINPLELELSVQCTLQKTWNLNGHSLLHILLANCLGRHSVFSAPHSICILVNFQCQRVNRHKHIHNYTIILFTAGRLTFLWCSHF